MANKQNYVELGLFCAEVCDALYQELKGKQEAEFSQTIVRAIGQLTT